MYELVLCHSFMPCHFGHGFAQDGVGHQLVRCGDWLINVFRRHQKTCLFRPLKASTRVATTGTPHDIASSGVRPHPSQRYGAT